MPDPEKSESKKGSEIFEEDELIPRGGVKETPRSSEGDTPDTAGQHGRLAPEAAKGVTKDIDEEDAPTRE